jgi:hypothetical protein
MTNNFANKRRALAIAHFILSAFAYSKLWTTSWAFWQKILFLLQPQFWILDKTDSAFTISRFGFYEQVILFLFLASTVIWSLCFSWLCLKLAGWLNCRRKKSFLILCKLRRF